MFLNNGKKKSYYLDMYPIMECCSNTKEIYVYFI